MTIDQIKINEFMRGYKAAAKWSSTHVENENDEPVPIDSIDPEPEWSEEALKVVQEDCEKFIQANTEDLIEYANKITYDSNEGTAYDHAGHDFWLTSNGHGAGFWDKGMGDVGKRLSAACDVFGNRDLVIGDDGKLYLE